MPFFTPGIVIATPVGGVPVEILRRGDAVVTRDGGIRRIVWRGRRELDFAMLKALPHLRPVLIRKGALGRGLPDRDMMVSPNHRMLVPRGKTALHFDAAEALVAAKNIAEARDVRQVDVLGVTYHHVIFDRHEVVLANGAWCECFQPGDMSLGAKGNAQRGEIHELFPELLETGVPLRWQMPRVRLKREGLVVSFGGPQRV